MASSDVDQKFLARQAKFTARFSPHMSSSLYRLLGLSIMLSGKMVRARRLRRLDTTRNTKSLQLYHHIIWLSREGLGILQAVVMPYSQRGQYGPEMQVMAAKLLASFFHAFCLFHNNPPITQTSLPSATTPPLPAPPSPGAGDGDGDGNYQPPPQQHTPPEQFSAVRAGKQPALRDSIPSYASGASFITNPFAAASPVPPGLAPIRQPALSSGFVLPTQNFLPAARLHFAHATALATRLLHGSHPLRLSVAIEHAAFMWDCIRDGEASRSMARRAIRECHAAREGLSDADFEDAAECVGVLGRMMRREDLGAGSGSRRGGR